MSYRLARLGSGFSRLLRWNLAESGINIGTRREWSFPDSYFSGRPTGIRRDKHTRTDYLTSQPMEQGRLRRVGTGLLQNGGRFFMGKLRDPNPGATSLYFFKKIYAREIAWSHSIYLRAGDGGVFIPDKWVYGSMRSTAKTVAEVLAGKIFPIENPIVLHCKCTRKRLFLFQWILLRMWPSRSRGNFQGGQVPVARTWKIYRSGY